VPPPAVRRRIGYVAHRALAYRGLTATENLRLFARLHGVSLDRVAPALERVGLGERGDERLEAFSRGMVQRLSIARALLHGPDLLLLDEPATGLDRDGRTLLEGVIAEGRGRITTIFSTHDDAAAHRLADRALTLRDGTPV
jgi:heme exporter protein A